MKQDGALVRDQGAPIDRLRAKLETTMARVDALAGELFDASNDVERLRAELDMAYAMRNAAKDKIIRLQTELDMARSRIAQLEGLFSSVGMKSPSEYKWLDPECGAAGCQSLVYAEEIARLREAQADLVKYLPDIVKNAMLVMWREICSDTECHPLDIEHGRGKFLTFEPRHWAQMTGDMVAENARAALAPRPPEGKE